MKSTLVATAAFASLGASASIPRSETTPSAYWGVTGFSASKGHLSSYVAYSFNVTRDSTTTPVTASCSGSYDAGSSSATWLASVTKGVCNDGAVSWGFMNAANNGSAANPATLGVFWLLEGSLHAHHAFHEIPGDQIRIVLNNAQNPYDNDVYYVGPKDFDIIPLG
ncbi:Uu.00g057130.m01.CDS01 [Anthostomella pinea]|uniref:Uu.00g057130.m01.CDS01 n=1 Tax=Anthostomella pinea TaxID=933095 RepID=A0AAI8YM08_9PEZI|nr:Uu.00g057130.m01.CDS01 [Anthostomella pinea]